MSGAGDVAPGLAVFAAASGGLFRTSNKRPLTSTTTGGLKTRSYKLRMYWTRFSTLYGNGPPSESKHEDHQDGHGSVVSKILNVESLGSLISIRVGAICSDILLTRQSPHYASTADTTARDQKAASKRARRPLLIVFAFCRLLGWGRRPDRSRAQTQDAHLQQR